MNYVFIFTGEFGYEMFNWQGVVRKWCQKNKKSGDKVIICSRQGLENIYSFADYYFNISQIESYNNTVADCYRGYIWEKREDLHFDDWPIIGSGPVYTKLVEKIKKDIQSLVLKSINKIDKWIWSHDYQQVDGCHFGHGGPGGGSIYSDGDFLPNNVYKKINIPNVNDIKNQIQPKINIDLNQPFILCQSGFRDGIGYLEKSRVKIDPSSIKYFNNSDIPILFLNFNSERYWDSISTFKANYNTYSCNNFNEQACLILLSKHCVFFTEGDFRSHTYVPPLLGKDVHVVASDEVLSLPSSSNTFWNKHIFTFGGQMYTYSYENLNKKIII